MASRSARAVRSVKMTRPRAALSSDPSACRTVGPKRSATRASRSASTVAAPRAAKTERQEVLPVAMPPVSAARTIGSGAAESRPGRCDGVLEEHGDCEWPHAPRDRCERAGLVGYGWVHVAHDDRSTPLELRKA